MKRSLSLVAVGLVLVVGAGALPAQETKRHFKDTAIKSLAKLLNKYVVPTLEWKAEPRAKKKIKLDAKRRKAMESFRKKLASEEKRAKISILKCPADLRLLNREAFAYTKADTTPGSFFQKDFKQDTGARAKSILHKYGYWIPQKYKAQSRTTPYPLIISLAPRRKDTGNYERGSRHLEMLYKGSPLLETHVLFSPHLPDSLKIDGEPKTAEDLVRILQPLVYPLNEFLRCHRIDWNRIYLEGCRETAILATYFATVQPKVFAGLILRDAPKLSLIYQENFHRLPLLMLESGETKGNHTPFKEGFKSLGFEKITVPGGQKIDLLTVIDDKGTFPYADALADVAKWITPVRRDPSPTNLVFRPMFSDFVRHWWVDITQFIKYVENTQNSKEYPLVKIQVDRAKNRIRIESMAIKSLVLRLNDELVDLDKPVEVEINGKVKTYSGIVRRLEMGIQPSLDNDPEVVNTAVIPGIQVPKTESAKEDKAEKKD